MPINHRPFPQGLLVCKYVLLSASTTREAGSGVLVVWRLRETDSKRPAICFTAARSQPLQGRSYIQLCAAQAVFGTALRVLAQARSRTKSIIRLSPAGRKTRAPNMSRARLAAARSLQAFWPSRRAFKQDHYRQKLSKLDGYRHLRRCLWPTCDSAILPSWLPAPKAEEACFGAAFALSTLHTEAGG